MSNKSFQRLSQRLKSFDYHSSIEAEFRVRTLNGAILSVTTLVLIFSLIYTEFRYNLTPSQREYVHVNATNPVGIEMEFDITFPRVNCGK